MNIKFPSKKEIWSIPNIMGYFRILLLPFIAYGILNEHYELQIVLLVISALTDFLDGKIARKFHMVTELGKALDPIADKLTLCTLFLCLTLENSYARIIAIVMLVKELYMLVMQLIVQRKCGKTSGSAKWYGKICTASLFIVLGFYLVFPAMTALWSNILMVLVVYIMIFTMLMYGALFHGMLKQQSSSTRTCIRSLLFALLLMLLYLAGGATLPFIHHPKVNAAYEDAFQLEDFIHTEDGTHTEDMVSAIENTKVEDGADTTFTAGTDRVRLIGTNDAALNERIRLIDMAEESIILSSFDFRADESGSDVIAALCDAADRKVTIQILVDGFSGILKMDGKAEFYELASKETVEIRIYNPVNVLEPWNLMGRMHDKYLIVDNYGYLLGGRNTYDLFLGSYNSSYKNLDMEVFVWNQGESDSSSINQVKAYFDEVWSLPYCQPYQYPASFAGSHSSAETAEKLSERLAMFRLNKSDILKETDTDENTFAAGKIKLISNPTHRNNKEPYVWNTLYQLMDSATKRVYVHTPYIICSQDMYQGLTAIGHKDIETRLLLNAPEIGANPFGCSDYIHEKENVLKTGFSVYEYMGNFSYHAKAVLIDDNLSIIGSYNLDMRSTYLDTELMLSIESPALNAALKTLMHDVEGQCKQTISMEESIIPVSVNEATFGTADKIKNQLIIWITRPIRYLL